jgi:hypothetical protein
MHHIALYTPVMFHSANRPLFALTQPQAIALKMVLVALIHRTRIGQADTLTQRTQTTPQMGMEQS